MLTLSQTSLGGGFRDDAVDLVHVVIKKSRDLQFWI